MFYRGFPMDSPWNQSCPGDSGQDRTSHGIRGRFRYAAKPPEDLLNSDRKRAASGEKSAAQNWCIRGRKIIPALL